MPMDRRPYAFAAQVLAHVVLQVALLLLFNRLLIRDLDRAREVLPETPGEMEALRHAAGTLLVFGDSVMTHVPASEKRLGLPGITDLLRSTVSVRITDVSTLAGSPDLFLSQLDHALRKGQRPRAVLLPVNPRSFSPHWTERPDWDFKHRRFLLDTELFIGLRALEVFNAGGTRPRRAYLSLPFYLDGQRMGTLGSLDQPYRRSDNWRVLQSRYLVRYTSPPLESRTSGDLEALLTRLTGEGIPTLAFIVPIDHEELEYLLAPRERATVARNIGQVLSLIRSHRVPCEDLSRLFPGETFDRDPYRPHEHLRAPARRTLVERLGEPLRRVMASTL